MRDISSSLKRMFRRFRLSKAVELLFQAPQAHAESSSLSGSALIEPRVSLEQGDGDDRLENARWLKLVKECIEFIDNLEKKSTHMDPPRQELAEYVFSHMAEILERSGVDLIVEDFAFDERLHRPDPAVRRVPPGTAIEYIYSPGFVVGSLVLRRARVRLKEEV